MRLLSGIFMIIAIFLFAMRMKVSYANEKELKKYKNNSKNFIDTYEELHESDFLKNLTSENTKFIESKDENIFEDYEELPETTETNPKIHPSNEKETNINPIIYLLNNTELIKNFQHTNKLQEKYILDSNETLLEDDMILPNITHEEASKKESMDSNIEATTNKTTTKNLESLNLAEKINSENTTEKTEESGQLFQKTSKINQNDNTCTAENLKNIVPDDAKIIFDKEKNKAYMHVQSKDNSSITEKVEVSLIDYFTVLIKKNKNLKEKILKNFKLLRYIDEIEYSDAAPFVNFTAVDFQNFTKYNREIIRGITLINKLSDLNQSSKLLNKCFDAYLDTERLLLKAYYNNNPQEFCNILETNLIENLLIKIFNFQFNLIVFDFTQSEFDEVVKDSIDNIMVIIETSVKDLFKMSNQDDFVHFNFMRHFYESGMFFNQLSSALTNQSNLEIFHDNSEKNTIHGKNGIFEQTPIEQYLKPIGKTYYIVLVVSKDKNAKKVVDIEIFKEFSEEYKKMENKIKY